MALHLLLIPLAYFLAFVLRFDLPVPAPYLEMYVASLMLLLPVRLASFAVLGLFSGWWRYVGMQDLIDLVKAVTLSSAVFLAILFLTGGLIGFPRSIFVIEWAAAIFVFGGVRFAVRAYRETRRGWSGQDRRATPALIIGAGEAAERLLRQVRNGSADFRVVGLLDDDPAKRGMRLHGVPVLGSTEILHRVIATEGVRLLVIAIPSASREEMKQLIARCVESKIEFKIVPPLHELLDGRARVHQLRKVQVEDLLGRESVQLDLGGVRDDLTGRVVLVTGGAGSIGGELARQIAGFRPARLVLVDQAESPLYYIDLELRNAHPDLDIVPVVADVTDTARIERVFQMHRPDHVFHAAAYKHVPMMELNIVEAVRNNVLGTLKVAEAAARFQAEKFVLISTDKAVHPSSVMGGTKRVAERIVLGWPPLHRARTDFRAVRFGNVLGSEGSVVPLFRRQLAAGGPLTVTHPEATRYFMTIPEAVQLVLQAGALPAAAGRILMLEMGAPVRILELAENLISLSGLEPYRDVPIVFTGLRPGEKLHEELMSGVEETIPTVVEKIRIVRTDEPDGARVQRGLDQLVTAVTMSDESDVIQALCEMVPECVSPLSQLGLNAARGRAAALPIERA